MLEKGKTVYVLVLGIKSNTSIQHHTRNGYTWSLHPYKMDHLIISYTNEVHDQKKKKKSKSCPN